MGGEGCDESEIADEFCFSGRAKGAHQGADHGVGGVAELCGYFGHAGPHGGGNARTVPEGQGYCYLGDMTFFGNRL